MKAILLLHKISRRKTILVGWLCLCLYCAYASTDLPPGVNPYWERPKDFSRDSWGLWPGKKRVLLCQMWRFNVWKDSMAGCKSWTQGSPRFTVWPTPPSLRWPALTWPFLLILPFASFSLLHLIWQSWFPTYMHMAVTPSGKFISN